LIASPHRPRVIEVTVTVHSIDRLPALSKSDGAALEALTRHVLNPARAETGVR
jgi:hypothetical protein